MTPEQAADIIQHVCKTHGLPMPRELAHDIARLLREVPKLVNHKPGEIARYHRDRYEEPGKQETET